MGDKARILPTQSSASFSTAEIEKNVAWTTERSEQAIGNVFWDLGLLYP
jgi:hypothetical protein